MPMRKSAPSCVPSMISAWATGCIAASRNTSTTRRRVMADSEAQRDLAVVAQRLFRRQAHHDALAGLLAAQQRPPSGEGGHHLAGLRAQPHQRARRSGGDGHALAAAPLVAELEGGGEGAVQRARPPGADGTL